VRKSINKRKKTIYKISTFDSKLCTLIIVVFFVSCAADQRFSKGRTEYKQSNQKLANNVIEGISSYYGPKFHGRLTASGEVFDMHQLTAAHKTLPFGTRIRVTNLDNNKQVVVIINDRGPFVKDRILDLSLGAAKKIDLIQSGTAKVKIEILNGK